MITVCPRALPRDRYYYIHEEAIPFSRFRPGSAELGCLFRSIYTHCLCTLLAIGSHSHRHQAGGHGEPKQRGTAQHAPRTPPALAAAPPHSHARTHHGRPPADHGRSIAPLRTHASRDKTVCQRDRPARSLASLRSRPLRACTHTCVASISCNKGGWFEGRWKDPTSHTLDALDAAFNGVYHRLVPRVGPASARRLPLPHLQRLDEGAHHVLPSERARPSRLLLQPPVRRRLGERERERESKRARERESELPRVSARQCTPSRLCDT